MGIETLLRKRADNVARALLGRELIRIFPNKTKVEARILEVSAWEGTNGDYTKHKFPDYAVGSVTVSTRYGKYLADITVGNGNSCVTLVAAEVELEGRRYKVQGPGNLCEALKIDPDFNGYDITKGKELKIIGFPAEKELIQVRNLSKVPPNCLGYFYILPRK